MMRLTGLTIDNWASDSMHTSRLRRGFAAAVVVVFQLMSLLPATVAHADYSVPQPLPVFAPHASAWQPSFSTFPYNLWQSRVTPEQIDAERESCQWFDMRYDQLTAQIVDFQHFLASRHDDWSAPGVRQAGDVVLANVEQAAAFLSPREQILYVINYDKNRYSPLYQGDSFHHLWYQFAQIADKMRQQLVSGVINANIATAGVYGNAIRDSAVCDGA